MVETLKCSLMVCYDFILEVWLPGTGRPGEGLRPVGQEREAG